jgi:mRNA-degrading endonuclease RelE of RelBE toxin-antitoxin system
VIARGSGVTGSAIYRIVAAIKEHRFVVLVVTVGHRREVYR